MDRKLGGFGRNPFGRANLDCDDNMVCRNTPVPTAEQCRNLMPQGTVPGVKNGKLFFSPLSEASADYPNQNGGTGGKTILDTWTCEGHEQRAYNLRNTGVPSKSITAKFKHASFHEHYEETQLRYPTFHKYIETTSSTPYNTPVFLDGENITKWWPMPNSTNGTEQMYETRLVPANTPQNTHISTIRNSKAVVFHPHDYLRPPKSFLMTEHDD